MNKKLTLLFKSILQGFAIVIGAVALALCLRIFVFDSYKIPSPSMEPSILSGDYVFVNKLILGPRIYKNFDFMDGKKVETKRLPGLRKVKRNDILVFNFPYSNWNVLKMDLNAFYIKRCIAIPGDTFYIDHGIYKVKGCKDTLGSYRSQSEFYQQEYLSPVIFNTYPQDKVYNWNVKQFGPLYLPRAQDRITIDTLNIRLYRKLIIYETDKDISVKGDTVFLGDQIFTSYVFKQNYYFMSGDNVYNSKDSRYWGPLPEDHIVGKAAFVWKSKDPVSNKYRFDRFFKAVR
ncbi:MAG: signal peptidase I [Bacteroidales bacterium]|nr:signal peptidase I [Bacteroidales bacterium]